MIFLFPFPISISTLFQDIIFSGSGKIEEFIIILCTLIHYNYLIICLAKPETVNINTQMLNTSLPSNPTIYRVQGLPYYGTTKPGLAIFDISYMKNRQGAQPSLSSQYAELLLCPLGSTLSYLQYILGLESKTHAAYHNIPSMNTPIMHKFFSNTQANSSSRNASCHIY